MHVSSEQTGGAFALADHLARRGNASPVHVHDRDDETFVVLDGELRVIPGGEEYAAEAGTIAVLPRRLRHAYVVTSVTARFLTLHSPAGFEQFAPRPTSPPGPLPCPRHPPDHRTSPRWPRQPPATRSRYWPRRPRHRTARTSLLPSWATLNSGGTFYRCTAITWRLAVPPGSPGRSS